MALSGIGEGLQSPRQINQFEVDHLQPSTQNCPNHAAHKIAPRCSGNVEQELRADSRASLVRVVSVLASITQRTHDFGLLPRSHFSHLPPCNLLSVSEQVVTVIHLENTTSQACRIHA